MEKLTKNLLNRITESFDSSSPLFAARLSLAVCGVLAVIGISLGLAEGSLAVLTNGLISAVDILNTFLILTAAKQSIKAPDYAYNYGYGKYESLSLLGAGCMLTGILGFAVYEAVGAALADKTGIILNRPLLISFSVFSVITMALMHSIQIRAAHRFKMPILEFEAKLWKIDTLIELGVILNLIIGLSLEMMNYHHISKILDNISAIALAGFALIMPVKGAKEAFNQLLDRTVDESIQFDLISVIAENINRFCEFKSMHTRRSGKDIFIELDLVMPYDYSIKQKFEVEKILSDAIKKKYPTSIPRVYVQPCEMDCIYENKCNCPVKKANKSIDK